MWPLLLVSTMVVAGCAAWLITRHVGPQAWPGIAAFLQLVLHVLWSGVMAGYTGLDGDVALPLASGLGVVTIAVMSAGLWLVRRRRRPRDEAYGVLAPEPQPPPELPRARVVRNLSGGASRGRPPSGGPNRRTG
jgi:hypothetical protein